MRNPYPSLGRPRDVEIREVFSAIFYQARSGCPSLLAVLGQSGQAVR